MERELEKSEGRELVNLLGWQSLLPENTETHSSSPTDQEFSVTYTRTVGVGSADVRKAYRIRGDSGQRTYIETVPADTSPGRYLEEVSF